MHNRASWLVNTEHSDDPIQLGDGSAAQFLCSDAEEGIGTRFTRNVGSARVKRLIVVSPYWDADLSALRALIEALTPEKTVLLVDVQCKLFPTHAFGHLTDVDVIDIEAAAGSSFVHAKLIVAETEAADHVLYGSANCTAAALGTATFRGLNDEACLYRRLPAASIVEELEMTELLNRAPVGIDELPAQALAQSLKFETLRTSNPGGFEVREDIMSWRPRRESVPEGTVVELFDLDRNVSPARLEPLDAVTRNVWRFRVVGDLPAFARVRYPDNTRSALACVTVAYDIYALARDVRGKRAEETVERLTGSNEVGVFMLEAIQALALAESEAETPQSEFAAGGKQGSERPNAPEEPRAYKILSYEEFVAGSKARSEKRGNGPGLFVDSGLWHVQQLLNRSIGIANRQTATSSSESDENEIRRLFRRGDETENPEGELNSAEMLQADGDKNDIDDRRKEADERERYTSELLTSVHKHVEYLWTLKQKKEASTVDVLRLRVVLMLIASASTGKTPTDMLKEHDANPKSRLVLPAAGDICWPRLMLAQLGIFFSTNAPVIQYLRIVSKESSMPSDILECWATCVWSLHACRIAVWRHGERQDMRILGRQLRTLPQQIYHMLGMSNEQFESDAFARTFNSLVNHFAKRLDMDPEEMRSLHKGMLSGE
ncbi:hypothetical protein DID96_28520 [Burkholderia sp. Bp8963]|nr:hypothetical protein DID96_28520 [Burkholderia sp. Bp8963]